MPRPPRSGPGRAPKGRTGTPRPFPGAATVVGVTVLSLMLVVLSGCGSPAPGPDARAPGASLPGASPLSRALASWAAFPVGASPRPLVLVGPGIDDPAGGFTTSNAKLAYIQGIITAPGRMPSGPPSSQGFPLITAAEAFHQLTTPAGRVEPPARVPPLLTTAARLGSATFQTDRGRRRLPAWLFSFEGVGQPAAVLAVAAGSIYAPRAAASGTSALPPVQAVDLSGGGRTITAEFVGSAAGTGPCTADYTLEVDESATAVAVQVDAHPRAEGANCAAVGYPRRATAALAAPLGARVVVDAATDRAVATKASS